MKSFKHEDKEYNFVNTRIVDGIEHVMYRHTEKPIQKEVKSEYIIVAGKKISKVKNPKEEWSKLSVSAIKGKLNVNN